jgi:hypothetical protein
MAILTTTKNPKGLVAALKAAIKIRAAHTWVHRATAKYKDLFTHNGEGNRFLEAAFFCPSVVAGGVIFNLYSPGSKPVEYGVWGVYHGRFVELLVNHGDDLCEFIEVPPLPTAGDVRRLSKPMPASPKSLSGTKMTSKALQELINRLANK